MRVDFEIDLREVIVPSQYVNERSEIEPGGNCFVSGQLV
jgi:hypothetical protein